MNGLVLVWSSQMPRPQKRHAPSAVLRQCQQSTSGPLLDQPIGRGDAKGAAPERTRDHLVEGLAVDRKQSCRRACPHSRGTRHVQQECDLTEVVTGSQIADDPLVLDN